MARLIEVDNVPALPPSLIIERGDLLLFKATGGYINTGPEVIELIGPFLSVFMLNNGEVIAPMGTPNAVIFFARHSGRAEIQVVTGDPFHSVQITIFNVTVKA